MQKRYLTNRHKMFVIEGGNFFFEVAAFLVIVINHLCDIFS